MTVHDVVQRSPEWIALRLGRLCASRAADMLAIVKSGGPGAGRRNLLVQLVLERITNRSQERQFQSQAMADGVEREADAVALYEALTGTLLQRVGFVSHDTLLAGWSPDGVLGDFEAFAEIKSPIPATHLEYLKTGIVPGEYLKQVCHAMWLVPSLQWCDWLSYNPDFPDELQVKCVRIHRDTGQIATYDFEARRFLDEVHRDVDAVQQLRAAALAVAS